MQNLVVGGTGTASASTGTGVGVGSSRNTDVPMDHEILKLRQYMQRVVLNILQQRQPSSSDDASKAKYFDVARRLEEGLFKMAVTKEDYMNQANIEYRITSLIKSRQLNEISDRLILLRLE